MEEREREREQTRARQMTHGRSGAVQFMVRVENKQNVENLSESGIRPIFAIRISVEHIKELLGVSKVVMARVDIWAADTMTVGVGC